MKGMAVVVLAVVGGVALADPFLNPYGVHNGLAEPWRADYALRKERLDLVKGAGIGWVRSDFVWLQYENNDGTPNWSYLDGILADAEARGIQMLALVPGASHAHYATNNLAHLDKLDRYVRRMVERYGMRLPAIELWNEPNYTAKWGMRDHPENFAQMLKTCYKAIKETNPQITVVCGGFAMLPVAYIEKVLQAGGGEGFDVMCIHPYVCPDAPEYYLEEKIDKLREIMAKYGIGDKRIWFTEIGWPTHDNEFRDADWVAATLKEIDPTKSKWRIAYSPVVERGEIPDAEAVERLREVLPPESVVLGCTPAETVALIKAGVLDAVMYPYSEDYPADTYRAVMDFVKSGGVLLEPGGVPMWTGTYADGRHMQEGSKDRAIALRVHAFGADADPKRIPGAATAMPTAQAAANGAIEKYPSGRERRAFRFFGKACLQEGDTFTPTFVAKNLQGGELAAAGIYRFHDWKGAVAVSGFAGADWYPVSEAKQAKMIPRALLISFARDIERVFIYQLTSEEWTPAVDGRNGEKNFGICHFDGAPKPAYSSYKTLAHERPAGSVKKPGEWKDGDFYFPQWTRPDGVQAGAVWALKSPKLMKLRFTGENMEFRSNLGRFVRPKKLADGSWEVPVDDSPVYFRGGFLGGR